RARTVSPRVRNLVRAVPTSGLDASRAILGGHGAREFFHVETPCPRLCPPYKAARKNRALCRLGKFLQHGFFVSERLLHARAALHVLEMRNAIRKARRIDIELHAAPNAPEEMRVRGGEMIEEELPPFEHVVGNLIALKQKLFREAAYALV